MRISDWSSDVCSSDLSAAERLQFLARIADDERTRRRAADDDQLVRDRFHDRPERTAGEDEAAEHHDEQDDKHDCRKHGTGTSPLANARRSEEQTYELPSQMRNSNATYCFKKTNSKETQSLQ